MQQLKQEGNHKQFILTENSDESSAQSLLQNYCRFLYERHNSYEAVARITQLDRTYVLTEGLDSGRKLMHL
jgi:hypothetical protein